MRCLSVAQLVSSPGTHFFVTTGCPSSLRSCSMKVRLCNLVETNRIVLPLFCSALSSSETLLRPSCVFYRAALRLLQEQSFLVIIIPMVIFKRQDQQCEDTLDLPAQKLQVEVASRQAQALTYSKRFRSRQALFLLLGFITTAAGALP